MPSIYDFKSTFQGLLWPFAGALGRFGATPNQVTIAAAVLSALTGSAIAWWPTSRWPLLALPIVLLLRMALNAIDGIIARSLHRSSRLGVILNELGDVVSDVSLYTPLALVPGFRAILIVAIVILAIITEMIGVVAVQIGASRRYDGPMGKSDRAFVFGAIALILGAGAPAGTWVDVVLVLMLGLAVVTIVNRATRALKEAQP